MEPINVVVNPQYRRLDTDVRKQVSILNRCRAKFCAIALTGEIEPKRVEEYQQKNGELQEEISHLEREVEQLKQERKATKKHITIGELPEDERFSRLSTKSKYLIDTIKMIAYRAETAMSNLLRERMSHPDEARSLLRAIYNAEGDILPDQEAGTLTIRLHQLANHMSSESI